MPWQRGEALHYMVRSTHDREFWSDGNRTHAREFEDCADEMCAAARDDLALFERLREPMTVKLFNPKPGTSPAECVNCGEVESAHGKVGVFAVYCPTKKVVVK